MVRVLNWISGTRENSPDDSPLHLLDECKEDEQIVNFFA